MRPDILDIGEALELAGRDIAAAGNNMIVGRRLPSPDLLAEIREAVEIAAAIVEQLARATNAVGPIADALTEAE